MILLQKALSFSAFAVLLSTSLLHFYWAAGGRWGGQHAIPTQGDGTALFKPTPFAAVVVGLALACGSLLVASTWGAFELLLGEKVVRSLLWVGAAVFVLRSIGDFRYVGISKRVRGTGFARADDRLFTPLCCFIAAGFAASALML